MGCLAAVSDDGVSLAITEQVHLPTVQVVPESPRVDQGINEYD